MKYFDYKIFLDIGLILLTTKLFGLMTRKVHLPQVVGALIAGILLGPMFFDLVKDSDYINLLAELGVIFLMFTAGMETDMKQMKSSGIASLVIATAGVIVPLIGGFFVATFYNGGGITVNFMENLFIGVILTATSVSITVETLREIGKLKGKVGTAILGAAVIDDIIGIVLLSVIISFKDTSVNIVEIIIRLVLFFVFAIVVFIVFNYLFKKLDEKYGKKRRIPVFSLAFCLLLSYIAEHFFGIADITGAFLAGAIISNLHSSEYVTEKVDVASYMLFSPIFFASVGIKTVISGLNANIFIFSLVLLIVAILAKVIGCGFGALAMRFNKIDSLRVGVGMVSRGEVALIVAQRGVSAGIITAITFIPVVIVVIVTTLITPILLKFVFNDDLSTDDKANDPHHLEIE